MTTAIVGYTGFVGSNICRSHQFEKQYNSKNITEAFGTCPDLLVYAGVRAEMFTANHYPEKDLENIKEALDNIKRINSKKLVLISTISVYPDMNEGNEDTVIYPNSLKAYGKNRLWLEDTVRREFPNALIVRLPALYGKGIKKNFIYDLIHYIPGLLKTDKCNELMADSPLKKFYADRGDGFYKCIAETEEDRQQLKVFFRGKGFSALNFTDSRSCYQYFNLANLWDLIEKSIKMGIKLLTITSEPIKSAELYKLIYGNEFVNVINPNYPDQNLKSIHAEEFGGKDGYIYSKEYVLNDLKNFINSHIG